MWNNKKKETEIKIQLKDLKLQTTKFKEKLTDSRLARQQGSFTHTEQNDTFNCGPMCLLFMENILKEKFTV